MNTVTHSQSNHHMWENLVINDSGYVYYAKTKEKDLYFARHLSGPYNVLQSAPLKRNEQS